MPLEERRAELYLELMKKCLTRSAFPDHYGPIFRVHPGVERATKETTYPQSSWAFYIIYPLLSKFLDRFRMKLYMYRGVRHEQRDNGEDWPLEAETMVGRKRLDNLHCCIKSVIQDNILGDFIETGVWRGGCCIFMRAALEAYGDVNRKVYLADSFEGMPRPDGRYSPDAEDKHWMMNGYLAVSMEQVADNFARYDLLDDRVLFVKGWFKNTLPLVPDGLRFAVLRLDGDLYESTADSLTNLYPRLSVGGYVIVDDYGAIPACRQAVDDFRASNQVTEPLISIDDSGVYWRKYAS